MTRPKLDSRLGAEGVAVQAYTEPPDPRGLVNSLTSPPLPLRSTQQARLPVTASSGCMELAAIGRYSLSEGVLETPQK